MENFPPSWLVVASLGGLEIAANLQPKALAAILRLFQYAVTKKRWKKLLEFQGTTCMEKRRVDQKRNVFAEALKTV